MTNLQITSFEDYQQQYNHSTTDPEGFWADIAQRLVAIACYSFSV